MDEPGYLTILRSQLPALARAFAPLALAAWLPLSAQQPAGSGARVVSGLRVKVAPPDSNQVRGVDAELRVALFDLASNRPLAALNRLEWLRTSDAAAVLDSSRGGSSSARSAAGHDAGSSRADLLFLLAESYNRLGMASSFHAAAAALAEAPGGQRYASIVGSQLMLEAYRRGDYAKVRELARATSAADGAGGRSPLASLLSGLAAYQEGDFQGARASFAAVRAEGGVYAPYAQLMDALALMGGDTTRSLETLGALRSLAQVATGAFGDHVRLIAAELAYESGEYTSAVANARGVGASSGLAPQALLTQGWALYRDSELDAARAAFAGFADRYPLLPERDEARLMAGQAMLEAGDADGASRYFQAMADSVAIEAAALRSQSPSALSEAARTLVAARASGIAFVNFPRDGKTLALPDGAGGDVSSMLATFAGAPAPPPHSGPQIVSVADIEQRLRTADPALDAGFPRRLLYTPASRTAAESYASRAQQLSDADVQVALARYKLGEQVEANQMKVAALEELQLLVSLNEKELEADAGVVSATRDSLASMRTALAQGRDRVRRAILASVADTRRMAALNRSMIDSVRRSFTGSDDAADSEVLDTEEQTAAAFDELAVLLQGGLDSLIARHPVFALADSLGDRLQAADSLHGEARAVLAADSIAAGQALAALRAKESDRTTAARAALAAAESRRAAAERELVSLVDADLHARALALAGELQRDQEAAEYGSANAAFFRAIEPNGGARAGSGTKGQTP